MKKKGSSKSPECFEKNEMKKEGERENKRWGGEAKFTFLQENGRLKLSEKKEDVLMHLLYVNRVQIGFMNTFFYDSCRREEERNFHHS